MSVFLVLLVLLTPAATGEGTLDFERRVEAQRVLERVYYGHQIGAALPFERAVPEALLRAKVARFLKQSAALERFWGVRVTAADLDRETRRILSGSRMPLRLREMLAALGNDPVLVQEFLVRPLWVDREIRHQFASGALPRASDRSFEEWWAEVQPTLDIPRLLTVASGGVDLRLMAPATDATACSPEGSWDQKRLRYDFPARRALHTAVWTGNAMLIWGGYSSLFQYEAWTNGGAMYDPATDSWRHIADLADRRFQGRAAIWTGELVLVWGDWAGGYRYDPRLDTWSRISEAGAPSTADAWTAWTGREMIVWDGLAGARYDPTSDTWRGMAAPGNPSRRVGASTVWTGRELITWGGEPFSDGSAYDPASDTWRSLSTEGAPAARHSAVTLWTGEEMLVLGGEEAYHQPLVDGFRYRPANDTWQSLAVPEPMHQFTHVAVWTGREALVLNPRTSKGRRLDLASGVWSGMSAAGAPSPRVGQSAVWTGRELIVWGGAWDEYGFELSSGARYDPRSDTWRSMSEEARGYAATGSSVIWTGSHMIVWGGMHEEWNRNYRALYDPATDTWRTASRMGAPSPRSGHTAAWTGHRMIIWGGEQGYHHRSSMNSGALYDPIADAWEDTSLEGAPSARVRHNAFWTGDRMLVWGGDEGDYGNGPLSSGGLYDPAEGTWAPTSLEGAPGSGANAARGPAKAVWTGSRMIVWAPTGSGPGTGALYDPRTDRWTAISGLNAPPALPNASAIWTGDEMILWKRTLDHGAILEGSGRYDPVSDVWRAVSPEGAPAPEGALFYRAGHAAVWTGSEMIAWPGSDSGARYDPVLDRWKPLPSDGGPSLWSMNAVWTGESMIVWGFHDVWSDYDFDLQPAGGIYRLPEDPDMDGDGHGFCSGDCNDADPNVHPGAADTCNLVDDDCDGLVDPPDAAMECGIAPAVIGPSTRRIHVSIAFTESCSGEGVDPDLLSPVRLRAVLSPSRGEIPFCGEGLPETLGARVVLPGGRARLLFEIPRDGCAALLAGLPAGEPVRLLIEGSHAGFPGRPAQCSAPVRVTPARRRAG